MNHGHTPPGFALSFIAAFLGNFVGSIGAGFFGVLGVAGLSGALLTVDSGSGVSVSQMLVIVGLASLVRALIAAAVVCWFVGIAGNHAGYGRAFGSMFLGGLAGELILVAWMFGLHGAMTTGAGAEALLLPLAGTVFSALMLSAPSAPRATAG